MDFFWGWLCGWAYFAFGVAFCMRLERTNFWSLSEREWVVFTLFWPVVMLLMYVVGPIYRTPGAIKRWLSARRA